MTAWELTSGGDEKCFRTYFEDKAKRICTNTIKYRKQSIDVIWGTNINNTVPFE